VKELIFEKSPTLLWTNFSRGGTLPIKDWSDPELGKKVRGKEKRKNKRSQVRLSEEKQKELG
jgi:hypothetical protein